MAEGESGPELSSVPWEVAVFLMRAFSLKEGRGAFAMGVAACGLTLPFVTADAMGRQSPDQSAKAAGWVRVEACP